MARLLPVVAVLAFVLAYPRIALMVAVVAAAGTYAVTRWLLRNGTVFKLGAWPPQPAGAGWAHA